ncbi:MAG: chaperone modulator CbpM [Bacteroidota bacterium]|nr:chaperone modulator CbpM [Bacteroidota bacterium]
MEEKQYFSAHQFCRNHQIEIAFLYSLHANGLITMEETADDLLLSTESLNTLEKMVRLHYNLHINVEGIDAIYHLLNKVEHLQQEVASLRTRLRLYEDNI